MPMVGGYKAGFAHFVAILTFPTLLNVNRERRPVKDIVITADSMFALLLLTSARGAHLCPTAFISLRRFW